MSPVQNNLERTNIGCSIPGDGYPCDVVVPVCLVEPVPLACCFLGLGAGSLHTPHHDLPQEQQHARTETEMNTEVGYISDLQCTTSRCTESIFFLLCHVLYERFSRLSKDKQTPACM